MWLTACVLGRYMNSQLFIQFFLNQPIVCLQTGRRNHPGKRNTLPYTNDIDVDAMKYCWVWQLIKTSSIVALNVVRNPARGGKQSLLLGVFRQNSCLLQKCWYFLSNSCWIRKIFKTIVKDISELCLKDPRNYDRLGHGGTCGDTKQ